MNATDANPATGQSSTSGKQTSETAGKKWRDNGRRRRRFLNPILLFLLWLEMRLKTFNDARVPKSGAGIVFYNHIHWLDPVIITGKLPRYAVPLTKVEASRWPFLGWVLKMYHVIFITRGAVDRAALKATWDVLADGDVSVISPEGTRSHDGRMQTAKEGLAFVAQRSPDCWLISAAVTGTPKFHFTFPFINRAPATITYGRPFRFRWPRDEEGKLALPEGRAGREVLREMTDEAMGELAADLPEEMRGDYAEHVGTSRQWLEFID